MTEDHEPGSLSPERLDRALLAAFELEAGPAPRADDSVISTLEPVTGASTRIRLRQASGEPDPEPGSEPATALGRYEILGEIARGGLGIVLRGRDVDLGREVAVKVLQDRHAGNAGMTRRLLEEAQIGGQLQHPGIVPVYEMGLHEDRRPFFTMKLVEGRTLADLLRQRPDPRADRMGLLTVFAQACHAIAYAHARGVVHRDLKPSNVMVGAFGEVQVVDWGLAKVLGAARGEPANPTPAAPDAATSVAGTPAYMAPEQAQGRTADVDARSDVFGLGAILCEILTGAPPYLGATAEAVRAQACAGDLAPAWARLRAARVEPELLALAVACLDPDRDRRPRDAGEIARRMQEFQASVAARAQAERTRRLRTTYGAAAVIVGLIVALGAWTWIERDRGLRSARTRQAVQAALDRATLRWGEARNAGDAAAAWQAAVAAAEEARSLAEAGEVDADTHAQAARTAASIVAEAEAARRSAALRAAEQAALDQLEEIRAERGDRWDSDQVAAYRQYPELFAGLGIDVYHGAPESVAESIRASRIATQLVAGLDDEVRMLRAGVVTLGATDWKRLARIADLADGDATRRRLRAAWIARNLEELRALANAADRAQWPAATLCMLAQGLGDCGDAAGAVAVLQAAHRSHPGDFWVCHDLAVQLGAASRTELDARLRFATAALALRPRSYHIWMDLAQIHRARRELPEAVACAREAAGLKSGFWDVQARLSQLLRAAGEADDAVVAARAARALAPERHRGEAALELAEALSSRGDLVEALTCGVEASSLLPDKASPLVLVGNVLGRLGDISGATAALEQALDREPRNGFAWSCLALVHERDGERGLAFACHRKAVVVEPRSAEAHHNLGVFLAEAGQLDLACFEYRRALEIVPTDHETWFVLGNARVRQADLEGALDAYRASARNRPGFAKAWCEIGSVLQQQGDLEGARDALHRALGLAPELARAHAEMGLVHYQKGDLEAAEASLRQAVEREPSASHLANLASVLREQGRVAESARLLKEALAKEPDHPEALVNMGIALNRLGRPEAALVPLRRAVALDPERLDPHNALGNALRALGRFQEAEQEYQAGIQAEPDAAICHFNLALLFLDQGKTDQALPALRKAIEVEPGHGDAQRSLGVLLYQLGRVEDAVPVLRRAAELAPENGETHFTLGAALERMRLRREALSCYQRAEQLDWQGAAEAARECAQWLDLEGRLPAFLRGDEQPRGADESLALANLCQERGQLPEAGRFWVQVLEGATPPPTDTVNHPWFSGALVAMQLGFGGPQAALPADPAAARWRQRTRAWLQEEIKAVEALVAAATPLDRSHYARFLDSLLRSRELAMLRDPERTSALPAAERDAFAALWRSLETLRARAGQ